MESNAAPDVVDWNGDGLLDILASSYRASDNNGSVVNVFINKGTATNYSFEDAKPLKTSNGSNITEFERVCIQVEDLNHDGKLDLILGEGWASAAGFWFYENVGSKTEPSLTKRDKLKKKGGSNISVYLDAKPCFGDLNGDNVVDFIAAGKGQDRGIHIYYGEGQTSTVNNSVLTHDFIQGFKLNDGICQTTFVLESDAHFSISLISGNGKVVMHRDFGLLHSGLNSLSFNTQKISKGMYLITSFKNRKAVNKKQIVIIK